MNKKSTKTKERRLLIKKTVNFKTCLLSTIIMFLFVLIALTTLFVDYHIDNSFSLRSDITNYHDFYYETRNLRTLQELENYLQENQMPYTIKDNRLSTELFKFDVTDTNNIKQLIKHNFEEAFNKVDSRNANTEVEVIFKDGKMIEKVKNYVVEKENMTYYQDLHEYFYIFIIGIIFIFIVLVILNLIFGIKITYNKKNEQKND